MPPPRSICFGVFLLLSSNPILEHANNCVGPGVASKLTPKALAGVGSAPLFAQMPQPPTKRAGRCAGGASRG
eukprot:1825647-Alexandrium_andersonii.AAC.1